MGIAIENAGGIYRIYTWDAHTQQNISYKSWFSLSTANIPPRPQSSEACSFDKPLASLGVYLYCKLPRPRPAVVYSPYTPHDHHGLYITYYYIYIIILLYYYNYIILLLLLYSIVLVKIVLIAVQSCCIGNA